MEKFDFGDTSIPVENNYPDIEKARASRETRSPRELATNLLKYLSSFYKETNKALSPGKKQKINKLLVGLAITTLSGSSIENHLLEKELVPVPISDSDYSFEIKEVPQPNIDEIKITLSPLKIKNEPPGKIVNSIHSDAPQKKSTIKEVKDFSIENMEDAVEEIYVISELLTKNEKMFPPQLFSETLLIAQDIAESDLRIDAESSKGSIGKGQLQPNTLKEAIRYLHILKKSKIIDTSLPPEDQLSQTDLEKICEFVKTDAKYADAFKNIYLIELLNHHGIGQNELTKGEIKKARKKILAAYNWNPGDFKRHEKQESSWPEESQNYYKKIFHYMEIINKIKNRMAEMKMLTNVYDLSPILTLEIKKYERELSEKNPKFDKIIEEVIQDYLIEIKRMEEVKEKPLTPQEVQRLIKVFNFDISKNYYQDFIAKKE